jgi:hypothetical protein
MANSAKVSAVSDAVDIDPPEGREDFVQAFGQSPLLLLPTPFCLDQGGNGVTPLICRNVVERSLPVYRLHPIAIFPRTMPLAGGGARERKGV